MVTSTTRATVTFDERGAGGGEDVDVAPHTPYEQHAPALSP
jgi:hypothetical protein